MFNEIEGLLQRVTTGEVDQSAVSQSTSQHVSSMDGEQVKQNLQSAAENANQNGESEIAQQITALIAQHGSNPQALKEEAISLITNNPQILQHFESTFASGILSRIEHA